MTRSDGVPLFAQELTKAVLDLRSLGPSAVPLTLQDSLMARLDRLGRAKDIAQIASVFGRQFSYALLEAIAGASDSDLRAALVRLRESGLIFEAGNDDQVELQFQPFARAGGGLRESFAKPASIAAQGNRAIIWNLDRTRRAKANRR